MSYLCPIFTRSRQSGRCFETKASDRSPDCLSRSFSEETRILSRHVAGSSLTNRELRAADLAGK